ncbi:Os03g0758250, partial [Oryza sativa Japonica Group]
LWDGQDDEEIEPEALEGAGVVSGDGAGVPDELAAADDEGLAGDVGDAELEEDVGEVRQVGGGAERRDGGGEAGVHVHARLPGAADGERVEEERVHRQRGGAGQQDPPVPPLHALAPRVEHRAEHPPRRRRRRVVRRRRLRLDRH